MEVNGKILICPVCKSTEISEKKIRGEYEQTYIARGCPGQEVPTRTLAIFYYCDDCGVVFLPPKIK